MNLIFFFIIGAIVGSFMNVCIYRLPKGESIVRPRSHCTSCAKTIAWYDNIPVLSFLILGGKCRFCKEKISLKYPIVEILSGIMCALLFLRFGPTPKFFIFWYFVSALIVVSFIDLSIMEIPDVISVSGIVLGLFVATLYPPLMGATTNVSSFLNSFLGIIVGGASIYALGFIGEFIFKKEAMGGGDIKLLAMIGAFLGWKLVLLTFFLAPFFGSIVGITLKIKKGKEIMPYGPHLSLAALVALFWGESIIRKLFLF